MNKHHRLATEGRIRPTGRNVLIQVLKLEHDRKTKGGIVIPDNVRRESGRDNRARVLAKGKDCGGKFAKGDVVLYDPLRLKLVLEDGSAANSQSTPLAGPDEVAMIHEEDLTATVS